MALRFRTPKIEELPQSTSKQAPGFAWVAAPAAAVPNEPANAAAAAATSKKRARNNLSGQTEQAREALSAKQQREIERRIRDLNSDNARAGEVAVPKTGAGGGGQGVGGGARPGKTTGTKKILASGKGFMHHVDDEEAEIALRGRGGGGGHVGGDSGGVAAPAGGERKEQRASKTPLARRKPPQLQQQASGSPAPPLARTPSVSQPVSSTIPVIDLEDDGADDALPAFPSQAEMDALLNAPPLTYNEARSAPPPVDAPPPRTFCEICSYWGRLRCLRCGAKTCGSVRCGEIHDAETCAYKPYA